MRERGDANGRVRQWRVSAEGWSRTMDNGERDTMGVSAMVEERVENGGVWRRANG